MFDLELVLGTAVVGVVATAMIQCANNNRKTAKRGAPGQKARLSAKSAKSKKSGKSKRSTRSSKKSVKSAKGSKKSKLESARSLKKSTRLPPQPAAVVRSKSSNRDRSTSQKSVVTARSPADAQWVKAVAPSTSVASTAPPRQQPSTRTARSSKECHNEVKPEQPKPLSSSRREIMEGKDQGAQLHMQPEQLRFATQGGVLNVVLHNPTDERQAVKVKCSDNKLYRVNPVYAFVEPNGTLRVDISRKDGGAKADKLIFVTAPATIDEKEPKKVFGHQKEKEHVSVLPLLV